jgi:glutaredoxin
MFHFTLYSKPGCHLCDEMKVTLARVVATRRDVSLDEIDITTDPDLADRYGCEIPVLLLEGKKVAKYRIAEADLTRMLEGR